MKKWIIHIVMFGLSICPMLGQATYNVIPWKSETTCKDFFIEQIHSQYGSRRLRIQDALTSVDKFYAYQNELRRKFELAIGKIPERGPLQPRVVGRIQHKQYIIEKVTYASFADHHITANLYLPIGKGRHPGVLLFCGHEREAKATPSYQQTAALFAIYGFVTLVIDPISQGERFQLTDNQGVPTVRGGTTEHTLLNAGCNLVGTNVATYQLCDNQASLDYLLTRSEVDPDKIGCLGNSGGGTQTTYFVPFDPRIKVAAVCSYLASRERNFQLTGANDGCQHLLNEGVLGFEMSDFLLIRPPMPLLILAGRYDFLDMEGTKQACNELQVSYDLLSAGDKFRLSIFDDGHGISQPKRELVVEWFKKWLLSDELPVHEPSIQIHNEKDLNCTISGQVNAEWKNEKNIQDYNMFLLQQYNSSRICDKNSIQQKMHTQLDLNTGSVILVEEIKSVGGNNVFKKFIIRSEGHIPIPVIQVGSSANVERVVLDLSYDKRKEADSLMQRKDNWKEGTVYIFADVPGFGELADAPNRNDPKYVNREYHNAMACLHMGSNIIYERVHALISLIDYAKTINEKCLVDVYALGPLALAALHTSVIDKRINNLYIAKLPESFEILIKEPEFPDAYSYVMADIIRDFEISDLIKSSNATIEIQ